MSQKGSQKAQSSEKAAGPETSLTKPWISMRAGVIIITITSIAMAVLTYWQAASYNDTKTSVLSGLMYGGLIWIIFFGNILINRFLRRRR